MTPLGQKAITRVAFLHARGLTQGQTSRLLFSGQLRITLKERLLFDVPVYQFSLGELPADVALPDRGLARRPMPRLLRPLCGDPADVRAIVKVRDPHSTDDVEELPADVGQLFVAWEDLDQVHLPREGLTQLPVVLVHAQKPAGAA